MRDNREDMALSTPESGSNLAPSAPAAIPSRVVQPEKLKDFLSELSAISESQPSRPGEDLPASGGGSTAVATTGGQQAGQSTQSWRDQAIANVPTDRVMYREIAKHIQAEVKHLRAEAKTIARLSKPGAAYHLNILYGKIHRLNALLGNLYEAGKEAIKRLYVRIFIDKQPIL
jgi:hypothetical protein